MLRNCHKHTSVLAGRSSQISPTEGLPAASAAIGMRYRPCPHHSLSPRSPLEVQCDLQAHFPNLGPLASACMPPQLAQLWYRGTCRMRAVCTMSGTRHIARRSNGEPRCNLGGFASSTTATTSCDCSRVVCHLCRRHKGLLTSVRCQLSQMCRCRAGRPRLLGLTGWGGPLRR